MTLGPNMIGVSTAGCGAGRRLFSGIAFLFSVVVAALPCRTFAGDSSAREAVHLLDYIAQDYSGAVLDGRVVSAGEFAEMREFAGAAQRSAMELPQVSGDAQLAAQLQHLVALVDRRATADDVALAAIGIKNEIIARTHLAVGPATWPNLDDGRKLYQQACAACHGASGHGDGPAASSIKPPPTDFQDAVRMKTLAPFHAFNTIRLGVPGTAMPAFGSLDDRQTWALAFYILSLRYHGDAPRPDQATAVPLDIAASESDQQIEGRLSGSAFDRQHALAPIRLHSSAPPNAGAGKDTLTTALTLLREADTFFRAANYNSARGKALAAYLDGIEPVEARLRTYSPRMVVELETRMAAVRSAIEQRRSPSAVSASVDSANASIRRAQKVLAAPPSSPWFVFSMAAAIVLREGFEAVLIIVAILSVLRAVGARHATKWVHAGWIAALAVGIVGWLVSDSLMTSSGMKRELLEAVTSLVAVAVLLYMGFWLHRRTEIERWKAFIDERVNAALTSRKLFALTMVSFFAVFREAVETVLFLVALSLEGGPGARTIMASGVAVSLAFTILLAWMLVRFSTRLPLPTMFGVTAILMMALSVVLAGKGLHSLQEIGIGSVTRVPFRIRFDVLGLYPTVETLAAQVVIAAASTVLWFRARSPRKAA